MDDWNETVKRILKTELVKRGLSHAKLAELLQEKGIQETKSSIDSKVSRGTFSAVFFLQCLTAMGCHKIDWKEFDYPLNPVTQSQKRAKSIKK